MSIFENCWLKHMIKKGPRARSARFVIMNRERTGVRLAKPSRIGVREMRSINVAFRKARQTALIERQGPVTNRSSVRRGVVFPLRRKTIRRSKFGAGRHDNEMDGRGEMGGRERER